MELILGNRELSIHRLDDIAPVLRARRARLHQLLRDRDAADGDARGEDRRAHRPPFRHSGEQIRSTQRP